MALEYIVSKELNLSGDRRLDYTTAMQGDAAARYILFRLLDEDGTVFTLPEGCTVVLKAKKPDETITAAACTVETGNYVKVPISGQTITAVGDVECHLEITLDGSKLSSMPFIVRVIECTAADSEIESDDDFTGLLSLITHNGLPDLQGGAVDEYFHLTEAQHTELNKLGKIKATAAGIGIGDNALKDAGTLQVNSSYSFGDGALKKLTDGANNIGVGNDAGKESFENGDLTNASGSIFFGNHTKAKANGSINEIVIGDQAVGAGNNTATFGNENIEDTILRGDVHVEKLVAADGVSPAVGVTPAENDDSGQLATTAFVKNALDGVTGNEGAAIVQMTPNEYAALENKGVTTFYLVDGIDDVGVTGVALNKESTSIYVGSTEQLTAVVSPENATDKTVVWSSSNEAVATVSQTGLVTAVSAGSATITVTTNSNDFTDTCAVTSQAVPAYPALWSGSRTQNGITAIVTGNRVVLNGTENNTDISSGSAYYTENMPSPSIFATTFNMWHTFQSGDQITLKCTYVSGSKSVSNSNAVLCLRDSANTILCTAATWAATSGTVNYTFGANKQVKGLLSYIDTNAVLGNFTFDIEFTVNGTRWI